MFKKIIKLQEMIKIKVGSGALHGLMTDLGLLEII